MQQKAEVISYTRRTDGVADVAQLERFLAGLQKGEITYQHPRFAPSVPKPCTHKLSTDGRPIVISWWSKDFSNLIDRWHDGLNRFGHHFSFTINGPDHSKLEPGLQSSLDDRIDRQLPWLASKCRSLGIDPNDAIVVHLDPISCLAKDKSYNIDHVPRLFEKMRALRIQRVHISFTQFDLPHVKKRTGRLLRDPTDQEKNHILDEHLLPVANAFSIILETCTYTGHEKIEIAPCVGFFDIHYITHGLALRVPPSPASLKSKQRKCTCYPFQDVGDKSAPCPHGCKYCFANPKLDF